MHIISVVNDTQFELEFASNVTGKEFMSIIDSVESTGKISDTYTYFDKNAVLFTTDGTSVMTVAEMICDSIPSCELSQPT